MTYVYFCNKCKKKVTLSYEPKRCIWCGAEKKEIVDITKFSDVMDHIDEKKNNER